MAPEVQRTQPPWFGFIRTTGDALTILEAARRGLIPRITRRLVDGERSMIRSGAVFVFDEDESGIKRWTDGYFWSPSRILGNFLLYRETEKRSGHRTRKSKDAKVQQEDDGDASKKMHSLSKPKSSGDVLSPDKQGERVLLGSLMNDVKFKHDGLLKKTFSLTINGISQHLISYYRISDVEQGRLTEPSSLPELKSLKIRPEYLDVTHFRNPPKIEHDADGIPYYCGEADDPESPTGGTLDIPSDPQRQSGPLFVSGPRMIRQPPPSSSRSTVGPNSGTAASQTSPILGYGHSGRMIPSPKRQREDSPDPGGPSKRPRQPSRNSSGTTDEGSDYSGAAGPKSAPPTYGHPYPYTLPYPPGSRAMAQYSTGGYPANQLYAAAAALNSDQETYSAAGPASAVSTASPSTAYPLNAPTTPSQPSSTQSSPQTASATAPAMQQSYPAETYAAHSYQYPSYYGQFFLPYARDQAQTSQAAPSAKTPNDDAIGVPAEIGDSTEFKFTSARLSGSRSLAAQPQESQNQNQGDPSSSSPSSSTRAQQYAPPPTSYYYYPQPTTYAAASTSPWSATGPGYAEMVPGVAYQYPVANKDVDMESENAATVFHLEKEELGEIQSESEAPTDSLLFPSHQSLANDQPNSDDVAMSSWDDMTGSSLSTKNKSIANSSSDFGDLQSHFVIFRPPLNNDKLRILSDTALHSEHNADSNCAPINNCVCSIYDSVAAQNWLMEHHNTAVLSTLRNRTTLPILAMYLSGESPAISVFCDNIESTRQPCYELAEISGFPVVIRPEHEYPWKLAGLSLENASKGNYSQHSVGDNSSEGCSSSGQQVKTKTSQLDGGSSEQDCNGRGKGNNSDSEDDESNDDAKKGGGGGGGSSDPSDPDMSKPPKKIVHRTNIHLDFASNGEKLKNNFIAVLTSAEFSPIPNRPRSEDPIAEPQITGHVGLKVKLDRSTEIDDAYSSIGFLVKDVNFFVDDEPIDQIPSFKTKFVEGNQQGFSIGGTVGLSSGQPKASVTMAANKQKSNAIEASEDQIPGTSFISRHDWTNDGYDDPDRGSYNTVSHHIKRYPPDARRIRGVHDISDLKTNYGLTVIVSEQFDEKSPKVSFVYRLQIHVWVTVKGSPTPRGIVIVHSNYIPDICTRIPLRIKERPVLDLPPARCLGTVPIGPTELSTPNRGSTKEITPEQGVVSFGTAVNPNDHNLSFAKKISLGVTKLRKYISTKGKGKAQDETEEITIQRHVFRGWDDTTRCWYEPVWPELDERFLPIQKDHCRGVWKLKWKDSDGN